jgi:thioesterase domain-containing protein
MEANEEFRRVAATIKQLELKLLLIGEKSKINEQYGEEAEQEIEEHFERCLIALAARKDSLLRDLAMEISNQSMLSFLFLPSALSLYYSGVLERCLIAWMPERIPWRLVIKVFSLFFFFSSFSLFLSNSTVYARFCVDVCPLLSIFTT